MACQAPAPTWLHPVNASVRDPDDPTKTERLLALDGAKERLHLFKAVFPEEGSFDSMVDGCEGVFHTASPFCHTLSNPQVWDGMKSCLSNQGGLGSWDEGMTPLT
uniref:Tetraketide alpha-pyrone reductase 1 n=1 Tax=Vitis vinifera TaxID=29760 RepID=F6HBD3_VITVI